MRSSTPVSCVSYMEQDTLEQRLRALCDSNILDFYGFIFHKGELVNYGTPEQKDDERDMDHIHLYMKPAKLVDFTALCKDPVNGLCQVDVAHPDKPPLACVGVNKNFSFGDWYLYNLHYKPYIEMKMEKKEFSYIPDDFHWSDKNEASYLITESLTQSRTARRMRVQQFFMSGGTASQLAYSGFISPNEAFAYREFEKLFNTGKRNFEAKQAKQEFEQKVTSGEITFSDYINITEERKL